VVEDLRERGERPDQRAATADDPEVERRDRESRDTAPQDLVASGQRDRDDGAPAERQPEMHRHGRGDEHAARRVRWKDEVAGSPNRRQQLPPGGQRVNRRRGAAQDCRDGARGEPVGEPTWSHPTTRQ
jgi:hypothetical protein